MSIAVLFKATRRFFRRRQGVIVTVGWLIILGTFIVKDVFRDSARDIADSINAAETFYLLRDDNLELHQEVDDVDAHLAEAETVILKSDGDRHAPKREKQESSTQFDRDSQRVVRIVSEVGLEMDNLLRLADVAPPSWEHKKQLDDLYKEGDALKMRLLRGNIAEDQVPLEQFDPKASDRTSIKTYADLSSFGQRLRWVGAMALDDAHETRKRKEHLVKVFTPMSYTLWSFGAILTLGSKLFGGGRVETMD